MSRLALIFCLFFCQFNLLNLAKASSMDSLRINEFMPNPFGSDTDYEWIELYNESENIVSLNSYKLNGKLLPAVDLEPDSYIVVARNPTKMLELFPQIDVIQSDFSLVNSGGTIRIESTVLIDEVVYPTSSEGISFERVSQTCSNLVKHPDSSSVGLENTSQFNFCEINFEIVNELNETEILSEFNGNSISLKTKPETQVQWFLNNEFTSSGSTIQINNLEIGEHSIVAKNSNITVEKPISIFPKVSFSEIMANPAGTDSGYEWIELFTNNISTNLEDWYIEDSSGKETIQPLTGEYPIVDISSITLNNSNETLKLYTPTGLLSDTFSYSETTEGVSLSKIANKWIEGDLTPGEANREKLIPLLPIIEARGTTDTIYIEGTVTEAQVLLKDYFFIQDLESGLKIKNTTNFKPELGNILLIKGRMKNNIEFEAQEIKLLKNSNTITSYPLDTLSAEKVGMLSSFEGKISKISGSTFYVLKDNTEIKVTLLKTSNITLKKKSGDFIKITGIIDGISNSNGIQLRILPRSNKDIQIFSQTSPKKAQQKTTKQSEDNIIELNLSTPQSYFQQKETSQGVIEYLVANIGMISVGVIRLLITKNY